MCIFEKDLGLVLAICLLLTSDAAYADNISYIIGDGNTAVFVDVSDDFAKRLSLLNYAKLY